MYDAIKCILSMFMIYEYNGCACKLSSRIVKENKSLIAGDNQTAGVKVRMASVFGAYLNLKLIVESE